MMPQNTRVLRRRAWRGIPGGRRATHTVETTYGRRQKERDRLARRDAAIATATTWERTGHVQAD
jgi:hypothetical protein